jgi:hypothetical protein
MTGDIHGSPAAVAQLDQALAAVGSDVDRLVSHARDLTTAHSPEFATTVLARTLVGSCPASVSTIAAVAITRLATEPAPTVHCRHLRAALNHDTPVEQLRALERLLANAGVQLVDGPVDGGDDRG